MIRCRALKRSREDGALVLPALARSGSRTLNVNAAVYELKFADVEVAIGVGREGAFRGEPIIRVRPFILGQSGANYRCDCQLLDTQPSFGSTRVRGDDRRSCPRDARQLDSSQEHYRVR